MELGFGVVFVFAETSFRSLSLSLHSHPPNLIPFCVCFVAVVDESVLRAQKKGNEMRRKCDTLTRDPRLRRDPGTVYSELLLLLRTGGGFKVRVYSKFLRIGTRINVFTCSWVRNVHNIVGFSRRNRCSRLENGGDYDDDGMKNVDLRSADLDL